MGSPGMEAVMAGTPESKRGMWESRREKTSEGVSMGRSAQALEGLSLGCLSGGNRGEGRHFRCRKSPNFTHCGSLLCPCDLLVYMNLTRH